MKWSGGLSFIPALMTLTLISVGYPQVLRAQPADAVNWKERFLSEAPKGWARYYAHASRLQGSVSMKGTTLAPKKQVVLEGTLEFKQAPGCAIRIDQNALIGGKANSQGQLAAVNPNYRFNLERSKASSPWILTEVSTELITDPAPTRPSLSTTNWVKGCVAAPIAINYNLKDDWPSILSSPDFNLLSVIPIQKGGKKLVQVDFDMLWTASKANIIRVKSGRVWFDPEHCWVMRKCDYKLQLFRRENNAPTTRDHSVSYDYEDRSEEFPLLRRMVTQNMNSNGEITSEEVYDYRLVLEDVPQAKFTLSAYGFPEPSRPTSRWHLWMIGAGVIAAGLAFWFFRKGVLKRSGS